MVIAKKQSIVSRFSIEAKYQCLASTTAELCWLTMLLNELRVPLACLPVIWSDNSSTISLAHNPVFHSHIKHIDLDCHFI